VKVFKYMLLGIILIIVAGFIGGWLYLRHLLPEYSGEIILHDINSETSVIRDNNAVPHIYADNTHDLYFALGYAQAQDRLFQMDFYRRVSRGRLSEILGKDLIDADRYLRTMGFVRTAKVQSKRLNGHTLIMINAFSEGVNYCINNSPLPLEFKILGYRPEPWEPLDSIAIGNLLTFQLASWAYKNELFNYLACLKMGKEKAALLLPVYPGDAMPVMEKPGIAAGTKLTKASNDFLETFAGREFASNNWVIAGKRTESGKPMLCSDSHEEGPELPTQWHMVHLSGPGIDTIGAMFPGTPVFIWGRNRHISWGLTNFNLDNQDLFIEKINPRNPGQVMFKGKWVDMKIIKERINYKDGKKMSSKDIEIRITPHGPIINDIEEGLGETPVSIRRVEAEPWSVSDAFYGISTATDWKEFRKALSIYGAGPQHFVYADNKGNIGYTGAGKCPVRAYHGDGLVPVNGWSGRHEWRGYYAFEKMPMEFNPDKGFIATANNNPVRGRYPIPLSEYWGPPYRAERITELIESKSRLKPEDMAEMQLDVKSNMAARIVPVFAKILNASVKKNEIACLDELLKWDYKAKAGSIGASIYEVMITRIKYEIFHDEMGDPLFKRFVSDKTASTNLMVDLILNKSDSVFFDKTETKQKETLNDAVQASFRYAVSFLRGRFGDDVSKWHWGDLHQIEFSHIFGQEKILKPFFNLGPASFGGDEHTINRAGFDDNNPYKVNISASIRYIIDFGNPDASRAVISTGQCAQLLSRYRTDMSKMFLKGQYLGWTMNNVEIKKDLKFILRFEHE
jgi:penicillin G amidase